MAVAVADDDDDDADCWIWICWLKNVNSISALPLLLLLLPSFFYHLQIAVPNPFQIVQEKEVKKKQFSWRSLFAFGVMRAHIFSGKIP